MTTDTDKIGTKLSADVQENRVFFTRHALAELVEDQITTEEVLEALVFVQVLENYAQHQRGACCLVAGLTTKGRWLHAVCTTSRPETLVITVYVPTLPKWVTPTQRGSR